MLSTEYYRARRPKACTTLLLITAFSSIVLGVSLSDFSPSATNLSPSCQTKAYTVTIPGCVASDFVLGNSCSRACLNGLVYINQLVYQNCQSTQDYQLLIAEFRNGDGIETLCPGVVVVTAKSSTSKANNHTPHPTQPSTRMSGTTIMSKHPAETSGLIYDSSTQPTGSYPITNITPLTTEKSRTTEPPSTSHVITHTGSTKTLSRSIASTSSPTGQLVTDTQSSPTVHIKTSSSAGFAAGAKASASKCVDYGGDPFDDCPNTFSNDAGPQSLRISWFLSLGAATVYILWHVTAYIDF